QARNQLEQARLQLAYTEVRAERAGVVSNLQLSPGAYGAPAGLLLADACLGGEDVGAGGAAARLGLFVELA
ncbi:hypothetical protein R0G64_32160, partial [Pseudomonas otitidis]|nr:hypothetical protein [Pseudomonas otitidis]